MTAIPAVPHKQPFPHNPFHSQSQADLRASYDKCLASERKAESESDLMYARVLGYFLIEVPAARGQQMVAKDIVLCNDDKEAMSRLAQLYINHIIHLFRQNKGKTPEPSTDDDNLLYSAVVEPTLKDH